MSVIIPTGRGGRGAKKTLPGKIRDCAEAIIRAYKNDALNFRYTMNYFGTAMRGHILLAQTEGIAVSPEITNLAEKAEALLKKHCDGKDCSYEV